MYLGISKYSGMKFFAFDDDGSNGTGKFVGDYYLRNTEFID